MVYPFVIVYRYYIIYLALRFTCGKKKMEKKQQKVSKIYIHDCSQNFILLFMSLLTAGIVKNNHILGRIYFISLNEVPDQI